MADEIDELEYVEKAKSLRFIFEFQTRKHEIGLYRRTRASYRGIGVA